MGGGQQSFTSFLHEIIHPSGGSQLANTQIPVICSKCHSGLGGPLPWQGEPFSRCDMRSALSLPLSTMSCQLELRFGAHPFEMLEKYAK